VLRGSVESGQCTSAEFTQELDDNDVLGSLGSTGDAYDNALAESFVDSFKTELISDRTWRSVEQAELAIVEWVSWFNHDRLHSSIGDIPPVEFEQAYAERTGADPPPGGASPQDERSRQERSVSRRWRDPERLSRSGSDDLNLRERPCVSAPTDALRHALY
jgi:putative transposase